MPHDYEQDVKRDRSYVGLGLAILGLGLLGLYLAGCGGQVSACQNRAADGSCLDATPSPTPAASATPAPATCSSGGCPIYLTILRTAENPLVAVVTPYPPGPIDIWVNGLPKAYPQGIAFVKVGDFVMGCRCCGCSYLYIVT